MSMIAIAEVAKHFTTPQGSRIAALDGIDLHIEAGEFVSLVGPSGCGKTTLLRMLADLETPSEGSLTIAGATAAEARQKRLYGYIFQSPTLLDWRSALHNVLLPLQVMGYSPADALSRAKAMLDLVGLERFYHHYPWQLSGGMQQRVSIARALSFDPQLLLMDEPFGALDEITREKMNLELLRLWEATRKTVVFVTHSIQEAVFLSTRVVVMTPNPGRIAAVIPIDLPQPRSFETWKHPRFFELSTLVLEQLRGVYNTTM